MVTMTLFRMHITDVDQYDVIDNSYKSYGNAFITY